jgi:hypothetical protein
VLLYVAESGDEQQLSGARPSRSSVTPGCAISLTPSRLRSLKIDTEASQCAAIRIAFDGLDRATSGVFLKV